MVKFHFVKKEKIFKYMDSITMLFLQNKIYQVLGRKYKYCQTLLRSKNTFCLLRELQVADQLD